jgi:hypothetical protein
MTYEEKKYLIMQYMEIPPPVDLLFSLVNDYSPIHLRDVTIAADSFAYVNELYED